MKNISRISVYLFAVVVGDIFVEANFLDANFINANDEWSSFQNGGAIAFSGQGIKVPLKWDAAKGVKWSIDLEGYGQSSPVVSGDIVYLTTVSGAMKEECQFLAIDKRSGKLIWKKKIRNTTPEKSSNYISRAAPTPVCDRSGAIAFFEGGNVVAYTPEGKLRWELDLVESYGAIKARHGLAASLEQSDEYVFVWIEREASPYLLAVNKEDGSVVWKSDGLGVTSWSSPRLVPVDNGEHLVLSGIGKIAGYDPGTGKQLWSFNQISGNSTPTPIPVGRNRFLIGASTGRGEETTGKAARSNGLLEIKEQNGDFFAEFVWQAEQATSTFGSPLAHNGHAYFVNRSGVVFCLDLETGKQIFAGRVKSSIWATPIGIGENVYLFGKDGVTTVVDAGEKFAKKATNPLWDSAGGNAGSPGSFGGPVLYAAVVSQNSFLLRRGDRLYCIE